MIGSRLFGFVLAAAVAAAPVPARARVAPAEAAPADDALAQAKEHHLAADAKYNTADYEGAIEDWQAAFAALPRTAEANTYRSLILYNIAAAREKLYELRGDVEQLKQAKILLERFEGDIDETYAGAPEEGEKERAQVREKLARIDALIADAGVKPPPSDPPKDPPRDPRMKPVGQPRTDAGPKPRDPGRGLVIGGAVLLGLGVVGGVGMGVALGVGKKANDLEGLADDDLAGREAQFDRGRAANAGAIVGGSLGLVCLAAGVALVVVGSKRRGARTTAVPLVGPGVAGLGWYGRF